MAEKRIIQPKFNFNSIEPIAYPTDIHTTMTWNDVDNWDSHANNLGGDLHNGWRSELMNEWERIMLILVKAMGSSGPWYFGGKEYSSLGDLLEAMDIAMNATSTVSITKILSSIFGVGVLPIVEDVIYGYPVKPEGDYLPANAFDFMGIGVWERDAIVHTTIPPCVGTTPCYEGAYEYDDTSPPPPVEQENARKVWIRGGVALTDGAITIMYPSKDRLFYIRPSFAGDDSYDIYFNMIEDVAYFLDSSIDVVGEAVDTGSVTIEKISFVVDGQTDDIIDKDVTTWGYSPEQASVPASTAVPWTFPSGDTIGGDFSVEPYAMKRPSESMIDSYTIIMYEDSTGTRRLLKERDDYAYDSTTDKITFDTIPDDPSTSNPIAEGTTLYVYYNKVADYLIYTNDYPLLYGSPSGEGQFGDFLVEIEPCDLVFNVSGKTSAMLQDDIDTWDLPSESVNIDASPKPFTLNSGDPVAIDGLDEPGGSPETIVLLYDDSPRVMIPRYEPGGGGTNYTVAIDSGGVHITISSTCITNYGLSGKTLYVYYNLPQERIDIIQVGVRTDGSQGLSVLKNVLVPDMDNVYREDLENRRTFRNIPLYALRIVPDIDFPEGRIYDAVTNSLDSVTDIRKWIDINLWQLFQEQMIPGETIPDTDDYLVDEYSAYSNRLMYPLKEVDGQAAGKYYMHRVSFNYSADFLPTDAPTLNAGLRIQVESSKDGYYWEPVWSDPDNDLYDPLHTMLLIHSDHTNGSIVVTDFSDRMNGDGHTIDNHDDQVTHSTAQQVFGGSSLRFDGASGTYLEVDKHRDFYFDTGDFTADFRVRFDSVSSAQVLMNIGDSTSDSFKASLIDANTMRMSIGSTDLDTTATTIAINTWYHLEFTRSAGTCRIFVDGVKKAEGYNATAVKSTSKGVKISGDLSDNSRFAGYIDEVRILKGVADHTGDFTSPTSPYGKVSAAMWQFFHVESDEYTGSPIEYSFGMSEMFYLPKQTIKIRLKCAINDVNGTYDDSTPLPVGKHVKVESVKLSSYKSFGLSQLTYGIGYYNTDFYGY